MKPPPWWEPHRTVLASIAFIHGPSVHAATLPLQGSWETGHRSAAGPVVATRFFRTTARGSKTVYHPRAPGVSLPYTTTPSWFLTGTNRAGDTPLVNAPVLHLDQGVLTLVPLALWDLHAAASLSSRFDVSSTAEDAERFLRWAMELSAESITRLVTMLRLIMAPDDAASGAKFRAKCAALNATLTQASCPRSRARGPTP